MSKEELKKKLHEMIDRIDDEQTLNVLKEDIEVYQRAEKKVDDLSDLTEEEKVELAELIHEDPDKEVLTETEFKIFIQEWRTRLSTKTGS